MKQAQLWGNAKEATTFTVAFSMDRGPLDMLIEQAAKTDAVLPEERTRRVTSENGWAITATTILQFIATLDNVLNLSKEEQAWIHLWDTASIHASEGTMTAMKEKFTSYCASSRHEAPRQSIPVTSSSPSKPEPAPEDPVDWATVEASDDEDDAPMPDLIDMPPAPASARPMSNLERCIALRLVANRRSHQPKKLPLHHVTSSLCCLTCPLSSVSCLSAVVFVGVLPRLPDSDKKVSVVFFFSMASKSVDTR